MPQARQRNGFKDTAQRRNGRLAGQSAALSVSPVLMRRTRRMSVTKIFPSPTLPVLDAPTIASITCSTSSFFTATSIRVLGTKSTTYSAPRYSSVWPRWRPKPLTSVTVMPETPISESAARTSSSLKGLIMAVINFIGFSAGNPGLQGAVATILLRLSATGTAICKDPNDLHHPYHRRRPGRCTGHRHPAQRGFRRPSGVDRRRTAAAVPAAAPIQKISFGRNGGRSPPVPAPLLL